MLDPIPGTFATITQETRKLLTFVRHCELDAHYQMVIAAKVQILPLTRQLTNLADNSWCVLAFYCP
jgi:DNA polymerase alpha subunit A